MKIALSSYSGYGAWFTRRLHAEGHEVSYFLTKPEFSDLLKNIVPKVKLERYPDYSEFDLSIFDLTGKARAADASAEVCATIGDGSLNCQLEDDRAFGIKVMEDAGIEVPPYEEFANANDALAFARKQGKRYVYKPNGGQEADADTTYVSSDASDMVGYLSRMDGKLKSTPCLMQEFISGQEISVEGWFDGSEFWLLNSTLEDKKFMNDNKGPNTGCSGNLVMLIKSSDRIYKEGLEKAKDVLQQLGYRGMIDLNTIVTEDKAYGLEWTPRFGYDASATLCRMYAGDFGEMLASIASGVQPDSLWEAEFGVSVRLSIPPYPSEIKGKHKAEVICTGLDPDRDYLYDICAGRGVDPTLETVGISGFIAAPIVIGTDIPRIWEKLYHIVDDIHIPNMQYRTDCGKSAMKKLSKLKEQGWV